MKQIKRKLYFQQRTPAHALRRKGVNAQRIAFDQTTMNISKIVAPLLLGALLLPIAANAQSINARQDEQRERIQQGVKSGQLNRREARRLRHREARLRRTEARDRRSGGHLTAAERANLQRRLNNTNRAIYRQKHDGQMHEGSRADKR